MPAQVRPLRDGEQRAFARSANVAFLDAGNDDEVDHWSAHLELGRSWVAEDRERIVGNACVFSRDVTVPGPAGGPCPTVPFAAVSGVGVHPTHRRQGLLRTMMATMLDDARGRDEAFAGLLASESGIYGRFGFGVASTMAEWTIATRDGAFLPGLDPPRVAMELLDGDEAAKVLPALHDRLRRRRAGEVSRDDSYWAADVFADRPPSREGLSARMYAVCDDGFVTYRGKEGESGAPGRVVVRDLYAATPETEAALWRYVLDIDLADEVVAFPRPPDDPVRWRLADPRALRTTRVTDFLWIRVLDTAATLTARRYRRAGRIVLDLRAPGDAPDPAAGRWVLDAGPDGSSVSRAGPGDATDVRLGLADLGAIYLGGVRLCALAAAGRAEELRPGALAVVDELFATAAGPHSGTGF